MNDREFESLLRRVVDGNADASNEPSIAKQVSSLFEGRWRFFNAMTVGFMLALFVATLFCAAKFLDADSVPQMLRWGAAGFLAWFGVAYLKLWTWLELERHAVTREVKRLEVQVAHLAAEVTSAINRDAGEQG